MAFSILISIESLYCSYDKYGRVPYILKKDIMCQMRQLVKKLIEEGHFYQIDIDTIKDEELLAYIKKFLNEMKYPM